MLGSIIKFTVQYKKCRADTKDCTVKQVGTLAKRIKFFRFDMLAGLEELEEEVAEDRCNTDPIKANKIEDYKKNKKFRNLFKGIDWNLARWSEACSDLKDLLSRAADSETCLNKLAAEIDKDLKKQGKGTKPNPDIVKLKKQIDSDLKEINAIYSQAKKIPALHRDPDKEYALQTKNIMNVKPSLSPVQKKFNTLYPQMLASKALKKTQTEFNKAFNEVMTLAALAEKAAREGDTKKLTENFQQGQKQLKAVEKIEQDYSKISKKFPKQIKKASNKLEIVKTTKLFVNKKNGADKRWEKSMEEIKKASKK